MTARKPARPGPGETVHAYDNEWRGCLPLSEAQLATVERDLGVSFPAALRALFLACNGGKPARGYFENARIMVEVGYLLPIHPPQGFKRRAYEDIYRGQVSKVGMPASLLPFAYDTGNAGLFCIDAGFGGVVYWVHDEPENPVKDITGSLGEFLTGLTAPPY